MQKARENEDNMGKKVLLDLWNVPYFHTQHKQCWGLKGMFRQSGHQRVLGSCKALEMMVLDAMFNLDLHIGNAGAVGKVDSGIDLSRWSEG